MKKSFRQIPTCLFHETIVTFMGHRGEKKMPLHLLRDANTSNTGTSESIEERIRVEEKRKKNKPTKG